ncbi:ATP-binding protein [Sphaerisporangium sp. NPDC088356]|uniref:ATP-binding protein n=1 Tax=Sphaerisporangium sp. NPDC088356 TaxID=3154871 RepID=UPI0034122B29
MATDPSTSDSDPVGLPEQADVSAWPEHAAQPHHPAGVSVQPRHSVAASVWHRAFPGRLDQAAHARAFVRFLLADTPCVDEAELIVSELAGNALRHTRSGSPDGWFAVEVMLNRTFRDHSHGQPVNALITVFDSGGGGVPALDGHKQPDPDKESGRGLATVAALAARIGYQGTPETGHRVWAYLALSPWAPLMASDISTGRRLGQVMQTGHGPHCSTSPSAPAESATSPAPPSS